MALFSDGEEAGLTGAAAFVREHPWARNVAIVLNFEGRGTSGPSLIFETGAGNLDTVRVLRRVPAATATSLSVRVYRTLPNDSDVSELVPLGQPAMNFVFADGLERYHTTSDSLAYLDTGSVQHHGVQALALARAFAEGPLPRPHTGDAVFFTAPGVGLILYPEWFAMPIAIAAAILVLVGGVLLRLREPHWIRGVILGIAGMVVSTALAAAMAFVVIRLTDRLVGSPAIGGSSSARGFYAAGIVTLALASASAGWALVRRWAGLAGAWIGGLLAWTVVVVTVTSQWQERVICLPGHFSPRPVPLLVHWPPKRLVSGLSLIGQPRSLRSR
jgi:Peptidase family M28